MRPASRLSLHSRVRASSDAMSIRAKIFARDSDACSERAAERRSAASASPSSPASTLFSSVSGTAIHTGAELCAEATAKVVRDAACEALIFDSSLNDSISLDPRHDCAVSARCVSAMSSDLRASLVRITLYIIICEVPEMH